MPSCAILVVDGQQTVSESLAACLREDGYTVDTATSGGEAVEKARQTDYAMYFVDGIETMTEIRRLHADASVIIMTAYAAVDTAITAMKKGAQDCIKAKNLERENLILRKRLNRRYHSAILSARMRACANYWK